MYKDEFVEHGYSAEFFGALVTQKHGEMGLIWCLPAITV